MKSFTKEVIYESDPRCSASDRRIYCYSRSSWRRFVTGLHGHEKPISFNTPLHSELYDAVMRLPSKYRIGIDFSETVTADQDGTIISWKRLLRRKPGLPGIFFRCGALLCQNCKGAFCICIRQTETDSFLAAPSQKVYCFLSLNQFFFYFPWFVRYEFASALNKWQAIFLKGREIRNLPGYT